MTFHLDRILSGVRATRLEKEDEEEEEEDEDEDGNDRLPDAETTGEEPALKKVVERFSDDSDDGLSGLKRTVERYSDDDDDDDAGLEEQDPENSLTESHSVISHSSAGAMSSGRNSAASPEIDGRGVSRANGRSVVKSGSSHRPVRLPEAMSPRKGVKNG